MIKHVIKKDIQEARDMDGGSYKPSYLFVRNSNTTDSQVLKSE